MHSDLLRLDAAGLARAFSAAEAMNDQQLANAIQSELRRRDERERRLVEESALLAQSVDDAMPHINNACVIAGLHGQRYAGPKIDTAALRTALAAYQEPTDARPL